MLHSRSLTVAARTGASVVATETKPKYHWGTGRRKTAVARVRICDGGGKIEINGRQLDNYFTETRDRNLVLQALQLMEIQNRVDVFVNVHGGGFNGQAGAIRQGVARALKNMYTPAELTLNEDGTPAIPAQIKKLRDSGLLTRDARMKERKKYGLHGARRGTQFSKR
jgi:small subunit ribosomal protein S9